MSAYAIKIQYPGTFLDLPNDEMSRDVYMLISTMENQLVDASLVLSCYEREKNKFIKAIEAQLQSDNIRIHRHSRFPHIYANYFVYALAIFGNCLNAIATEYDFQENIQQIKDNYKAQLPPLWDIRHSLLHIEDRVRILGRPKRDGTKNKVLLQGNLLVLGSLIFNRDALTCTVANGSLQEIEISRATLNIAEETLQNLINNLPWKGFPHGYLTDKASQRFMKRFTKWLKITE